MKHGEKTTVRVTITMPADLRARLSSAAALHERSESWIVSTAVRHVLSALETPQALELKEHYDQLLVGSTPLPSKPATYRRK